MKNYEVTEPFADIQDGYHVYKTGDKYPREGAEADGQRISELLSTGNRLGKPLIKEVVVRRKKTED